MAIFTVTNLDDSGDGSLRQAIETANEQEGRDIIGFDKSLRGETITLTSGELKVTDDLTIAGPGANQLTVSGGGNSRVFNIDDETDELTGVSITGLQITGGFSDEDAGGIKSNENLTVANSIIAGNSSEEEGGGIDVGSSEVVTIINSTISNNTANGDGGGIVGAPNMTNSTVSDNTAGFQGGGIFSEGNATVTNSIISGNISSNDSGGGIFSFGELEVVNSNIAGNIAEFQGGGIFSDGGQVTVADSTIIGNTANNSNGGGIANSENSTVEIARSTITNNTSIAPNSIDGGGGLFNRGEAIVSDSTIARNTTGGQGGGVKNEGGTIEIARSNIAGNSANGGSGISNTPPQDGRISRLTVRDSDIIGNTANVASGGIDNSGGIVEIERTTIAGNTAEFEGGGGISNNDGGILGVTKGTISGNTAGTDGGGIANSEDSTLTLVKSNITGNAANNNGGGILNDGDTIATDSTISLNIADFDRDGMGDGGGVFNSAAATFTNNNSLIFGNTPNDVFTEGMSMMDGAAFTDMAVLA